MTEQSTFGRIEFYRVDRKGEQPKCNSEYLDGSECENRAVIAIRDGKSVSYFCKSHSKECWLEKAGYHE